MTTGARPLPQLAHPGPAGSPRIQSLPSRAVGVFAPLRPGRSLAEELLRLTTETGATSAFAELLPGTLSPVHYCVPAGADEHRCASFSEERISPRAHLLAGSATIGLRDGRPFVHTHLEWLDDNGARRAGHSWPASLVATPAPSVALFALPDVRWVNDDDPETRLPTFTPHSQEELLMPETPPQHGVTVARLLPNQDLTQAILSTCRSAGHSRVVVRAGLGSLIGARLMNPATADILEVDGPATEVISLSGFVAPDEHPQARLSCTLVDRHGQVHSGLLVPGENVIAVTFELSLQPVASLEEIRGGASA